MNRIVGIAVLVTFALAAPLLASVPIVHPAWQLNQAYAVCDQNLRCSGYAGLNPAPRWTPGFLMIDPGENWANFVGAAGAGVDYLIKNVVLQKQTPDVIQCSDVFPPKTIVQQGPPNIRLMWPLMYEVPGTQWTLDIIYGTPVPWDDDGPGPNLPGFVHAEQWSWFVKADVSSMLNLLGLFRQIPLGTAEVPLISDEVLYDALRARLVAAQTAFEAGDIVLCWLTLSTFELEVIDACIAVAPLEPIPTGPGTGIAQSYENPACCKLVVDAEYFLSELGYPP